jgi:carbon storage regulator
MSMLVLSRKVGEKVVVPGLDVAITVVAIEGNRVRLGISAPDAIGVYRAEIWNRIRETAPALPPDGDQG